MILSPLLSALYLEMRHFIICRILDIAVNACTSAVLMGYCTKGTDGKGILILFIAFSNKKQASVIFKTKTTKKEHKQKNVFKQDILQALHFLFWGKESQVLI